MKKLLLSAVAGLLAQTGTAHTVSANIGCIGHLQSGTEAPQRLVLPPCGTMGMRSSERSATTRETSSVFAGRTTAAARPW